MILAVLSLHSQVVLGNEIEGRTTVPRLDSPWRQPEAASYSFMKRAIFPAAICVGALLSLTYCATGGDDPFPVHPDASQNTAEPVPGAETPAPNSSNEGWSW
jgi:hypothetical protein